MITAVDTNVLLDVFGADPCFLPGSRAALRTCIARGKLIACDIVWAEVAAFFSSAREAREAMDKVGIDFDPMSRDAALAASTAWRAYRDRGGRRTRLIPDFLIGAHAERQADRLLSRDRGFYRSYFASLTVLDPTEGQ